MRLTRRKFLRIGLLSVPAPLLLVACGSEETQTSTQLSPAATSTPASSPTGAAGGISGATQLLTPTPACGDADDPTPAQTEGPYFTPSLAFTRGERATSTSRSRRRTGRC